MVDAQTKLDLLSVYVDKQAHSEGFRVWTGAKYDKSNLKVNRLLDGYGRFQARK